MLRSLLIYFSTANWARRLVTRWRFVRRTASRFVAGESAEAALQACQLLNDRGLYVTLDHLGEGTTSREEALRATDEIIHLLDEIERTAVQASVSIKLTQLGLKLDDAICEENLLRVLTHARANDNFVRIDMEDSLYTDDTLKLFRKMLEAGFKDSVGVVIQAYLYRSEEDLRRLIEDRAHVRLCKGAYNEPPHLAFERKRDVDVNYDRLGAMLMDGSLNAAALVERTDGRRPPLPAIATHDETRILQAKRHAEQIGLPKTSLEFQMLFGIRRKMQDQLAAEGYQVRVYVPYGTEWFPYFMRRLAERPANLWFFLSNVFRR